MHGSESSFGRLRQESLQYQYPYQTRYGSTYEAPVPTGPQFFLALTAAAPEQRMSVQYQRSPLGLGRLDDLPFTDSTSSKHAAMIVWVQDAAGNFTIYRKLLPSRATAESP
jgi:hypothetical protein